MPHFFLRPIRPLIRPYVYYARRQPCARVQHTRRQGRLSRYQDAKKNYCCCCCCCCCCLCCAVAAAAAVTAAAAAVDAGIERRSTTDTSIYISVRKCMSYLIIITVYTRQTGNLCDDSGAIRSRSIHNTYVLTNACTTRQTDPHPRLKFPR